MKKMLFLALLLGAWSVMTTVSLAQNATGSTPATDKNAATVSPAKGGNNFVDKDKDGVCDNLKNRQANPQGKGLNFTDKDKDGVCDHRGTLKGTQKNCPGMGVGHKNCGRHQQGCCPGNGSGKGLKNNQTTVPDKK